MPDLDYIKPELITELVELFKSFGREGLTNLLIVDQVTQRAIDRGKVTAAKVNEWYRNVLPKIKYLSQEDEKAIEEKARAMCESVGSTLVLGQEATVDTRDDESVR